MDQSIGIGHALMLAQVLHPRFYQKGLDHAARLGGVLEDAPGIGAVAAPFVFELRQRLEERLAILGPDPIFDGNQDRSAVLFDRPAR